MNKIIFKDCKKALSEIEENSVDLICTDPPYGYSFMGKDWDKAVPSVEIWKECLRVLKPGAFCFVMSAPRQDCLSRMIMNLSDAGFETDFTSIYWTYATGFPKAGNIGKMVDKQAGAEREILGLKKHARDGDISHQKSYQEKPCGFNSDGNHEFVGHKMGYETIPATSEAKALDGSYAGFQPKPAVEVIIVCMKPLSEKTYVDQALANGKGCTWLGDCKIPIENVENEPGYRPNAKNHKVTSKSIFRDGAPPTYDNGYHNSEGRFPANLLVSDDVLNDGKITNNHRPNSINNKYKRNNTTHIIPGKEYIFNPPNDSGSYSRYFDLDAWWAEKLLELPESIQKTFPFLIVPKPSKAEKNQGLNGGNEKHNFIVPNNPTCILCKKSKYERRKGEGICQCNNPKWKQSKDIPNKNSHPTCKPIKLMSYLITLGSRPGDIVLDPFVGSGTTAIAAKILNRQYIGIDNDSESVTIAEARLSAVQVKLDI